MKRRCIISPKGTQKAVKASNDAATKKAKKDVYEKLQAAFNAIEFNYDTLKEEYGTELDEIYNGLEILVRELELDI